VGGQASIRPRKAKLEEAYQPPTESEYIPVAEVEVKTKLKNNL